MASLQERASQKLANINKAMDRMAGLATDVEESLFQEYVTYSFSHTICIAAHYTPFLWE